MNEYGFSQGIARNASQSEYPHLWRGLVGLWSPRAGTQGQKLVDYVNRRDGTLTNGPEWQSGRFGWSLNFDGTNDYVATPGISYGLSGNCTFLAWVNAAALDANVRAAVVSEQAANYWVFLGGSGTAGQVQFALFDGTNNPKAAAAATVGKWIFLAGVRKSGNIILYVDGIQAATTADTTTSVPAYSAFNIGSQITVARRWSGKIGDVRIYNRALSAAEIMQSYMGASPLVRAVTTFGKSVSAAATAIFRNRTGSRSRLISS